MVPSRWDDGIVGLIFRAVKEVCTVSVPIVKIEFLHHQVRIRFLSISDTRMIG